MLVKKLSIESMLDTRHKVPPKRPDFEKLHKYLTYLGIYHLPIQLRDQKWIIELSTYQERMAKDGMAQLSEAVPQILDECTIQSYYLLQKYRNQGFKNYVPSLPLLNILQDISVDFSADMLQDGSQGYFEVSHANIIPPKHWSNSPMAYILYRVESRGLIIAIEFQGEDSGTSFYIPLESGKNLADILRDFKFRSLERDGQNIKVVSQDIDQTDIDALNLVFNLITYVTNPSEEFITAYNKLTPKQANGQEYTTKPYVLIGTEIEKNWENLRAVSGEAFEVSGHWRWQPCGMGRLNRKLTFIKPYLKTLSK